MPASISDDYAVINIGNLECYYGYEEVQGDEWCFYAKVHGKKDKFIIPSSRLHVRDKQDCAACLLDGLEKFFNDHKFELPFAHKGK